jgi:hypothetical protein
MVVFRLPVGIITQFLTSPGHAAGHRRSMNNEG